MKTVVSVSMAPELASTIRETLTESGKSFSGRVCQLIEAGLQKEAFDNRELTVNYGYVKTPPGLFDGTTTTDEDLEVLVHPDDVEEPEAPQPVDEGVMPLERVFNAVTDVRRSVAEIAAEVGLDEGTTLELLDELIDVDNSPFTMERVSDVWFSWRVG